MLMPEPVASATPIALLRINHQFRQTLEDESKDIRAAENKHFRKVKATVSKRGIYTKDIRPKVSTRNIGSRRAAIEEFGESEVYVRRGWGRSARSRSHSRSKERYRRLRQDDSY